MPDGVVLDPAYLAAVRARCEAATPGPWVTTRPEPLRDGPAKGFSPGVLIAATSPSRENRVYATPPGGQYPSADQRFIAHAREDVPTLLAAAEGYAAAVAEAKEVRTLLRQARNRLQGSDAPAGLGPHGAVRWWGATLELIQRIDSALATGASA